MTNTKNILDQLMKMGSDMINSPAKSVQSQQTNSSNTTPLDPLLKGLAAGIGGGMLGSILGAKNGANSLGKMGGMAALAALAYRAYQNYSGNQTQLASDASADEIASTLNFNSDADADNRAKTMLIAIINAAKADGIYDEQEQLAIRDAMKKIPSIANNDTWVQAELNKPLDIDYVASLAKTPQMATEIYLVSLITCREKNSTEQAYLSNLAHALNIDAALQKAIEDQVAG